MIYRMKQNAASLSLICIMSTGVLLLISSTTSLYVGQEHSLYMHYPKEFRISLSLGTEPDDSAQFEKELKEIGTYAENYLKDNKIDVKNEESQALKILKICACCRQSRWKIITGKQKRTRH